MACSFELPADEPELLCGVEPDSDSVSVDAELVSDDTAGLEPFGT